MSGFENSIQQKKLVYLGKQTVLLQSKFLFSVSGSKNSSVDDKQTVERQKTIVKA